jgi:hypothetical protein
MTIVTGDGFTLLSTWKLKIGYSFTDSFMTCVSAYEPDKVDAFDLLFIL